MELFTELETQIRTLRLLLGEGIEPTGLVPRTENLGDTEVIASIAAATALIQCAERIRTAATGVVAARSARASAQAGLAQSHGHRNAASLVQELTGSTKAEAARQVRVGESLLASATVTLVDDAAGALAHDGTPADDGTGSHDSTGPRDGTW